MEAGATEEETPEYCLGTLYKTGTGQVDGMEGRDLLKVEGGKQRSWLVQ